MKSSSATFSVSKPDGSQQKFVEFFKEKQSFEILMTRNNNQEQVQIRRMNTNGDFVIEQRNTLMWNPLLHLVLYDKYRVFEKLDDDLPLRWFNLPMYQDENSLEITV